MLEVHGMIFIERERERGHYILKQFSYLLPILFGTGSQESSGIECVYKLQVYSYTGGDIINF
jgi:uncharacterized membrane protein (UPF0127 family)